MEIINYIYDSYGERGTKRFVDYVGRILKGIDAAEVICHNAWYERNGAGSYSQCAEIEIDGESHVIRNHTNDSWAWDGWDNPTAKDKRNLFLAVIDEQIDTIKELLNN